MVRKAGKEVEKSCGVRKKKKDGESEKINVPDRWVLAKRKGQGSKGGVRKG